MAGSELKLEMVATWRACVEVQVGHRPWRVAWVQQIPRTPQEITLVMPQNMFGKLEGFEHADHR